jgi:hypothetical protein
MMESELVSAGLMPTLSRPCVDVEAFLESHLGVQLDQHALLDPGVLGLTQFFPDAPPRVLINRDLTGAAIDDDESAAGVLGRWRATLAHEASHVVLHRALFESDDSQGDLFTVSNSVRQSAQLMRCMKTDVLYRDGGSDWREVQANRGMASLLMPGSVFADAAKRTIQSLCAAAAKPGIGSTQFRLIVAELAARFAVSRQAAAIRLETLQLVSSAGQSSLDLS